MQRSSCTVYVSDWVLTGHGLVRDTSVRVNLLEDTVDIGRVGLLADLGRLLLLARLGGGLGGLLGSLRGRGLASGRGGGLTGGGGGLLLSGLGRHGDNLMCSTKNEVEECCVGVGEKEGKVERQDWMSYKCIGRTSPTGSHLAGWAKRDGSVAEPKTETHHPRQPRGAFSTGTSTQPAALLHVQSIASGHRVGTMAEMMRTAIFWRWVGVSFR